MTKPWPVLQSDEEAERFVSDANLSDYDIGQMVPMKFESSSGDRRVTIRLSAELLTAVKAKAKARGIPYQRFIREVLARAIERGEEA